MKKALLALSIIILLLMGCGLNQNPPSYIKQVSAYKEGSDGLVIYFILADSSGAMTTSEGTAKIVITEERSSGKDTTLYQKTVTVNLSSFVKTKIGQGSFQREAILFSFGRIPYSSLTLKPQASSGKVKIEFTAGSKTMQGEDSIFW